MTEDELAGLIATVRGQEPSQDFVTMLRQRIRTEPRQAASSEPVEAGIVDLVDPTVGGDEMPPAWRRPLLVAAMLALLVGFGAMLTRGDSDPVIIDNLDTAVSPDSPTAPSTPVTTPTSTPGQPAQPPPDPVTLSDLASWTWTRHEAVELGLLGAGESVDVTASVFGDGVFVSAGYRHRSSGADGFVETPFIWASRDGLSWSTIDLGAAELGEGLYSVTFGAGGFVAVGEVGGDAIGAPPSGSGVVWISADGLTWNRHAPEEWTAFVPRAVTPDLDGGYLAVGASSLFSASIWRSTDGMTWTEVGVFEHPEAIEFRDVASGPDGYVAVGARGMGENRRAFVAWSTDGRTWEEALGDSTVFPRSSSLLETAAGNDGGFIAAGSDLGLETRAALWISPDGVTWQRTPVEPNDSFTYIGDLITVADLSVTLVSGAQALTEQPWIESGAIWLVTIVEGAPVLEPLSIEDVSLGQGVWNMTVGDERVVALGRDGQNGDNSDIIVWTASPD